jgi:hypothetical protein
MTVFYTLLTLLLVLAAPRSEAACLWVLWTPTSAHQRSVTGDWSPDETFETKNRVPRSPRTRCVEVHGPQGLRDRR